MKNKILAPLGVLALTAGSAFAAAGDGFTEATTIASASGTLVTAILAVIVPTIGIGIALSLVKMVKRK